MAGKRNKSSTSSAPAAASTQRVTMMPFTHEDDLISHFFPKSGKPILPANLDNAATFHVDLDTEEQSAISFLEAVVRYLDLPKLIDMPLAPFMQHIKERKLLLIAIKTHRNAILKTMIANLPHGWFTELQDNGFNALHAAALSGNEEVVALLLKNPEVLAHINDMDGSGKTALTYAVMNDHKKIIALLLAKNANPDVTDSADPKSTSAYEIAASLSKDYLMLPNPKEVERLAAIRTKRKYNEYALGLEQILVEIYGLGVTVALKKLEHNLAVAASPDSYVPINPEIAAAEQLLRTTPELEPLINFELFHVPRTENSLTEIHNIQRGVLRKSKAFTLHCAANLSHLKRLRALHLQLVSYILDSDHFDAFCLDKKVNERLSEIILCSIHNADGASVTDQYASLEQEFLSQHLITMKLHSVAAQKPLRFIVDSDNPYTDLLLVARTNFLLPCAVATIGVGVNLAFDFEALQKITTSTKPDFAKLRKMGLKEERVVALENYYDNFRNKEACFRLSYSIACLAQAQIARAFSEYRKALNILNDTVEDKDPDIRLKTTAAYLTEWEQRFEYIFWSTMSFSKEVLEQEEKLARKSEAVELPKEKREPVKAVQEIASAATVAPTAPLVLEALTPPPAPGPIALDKVKDEKYFKAVKAAQAMRKAMIEALPDEVRQKIEQLKTQISLLSQLHRGTTPVTTQAHHASLAMQIMKLFVQCIALAKSNAEVATLLSESVELETLAKLCRDLQAQNDAPHFNGNAVMAFFHTYIQIEGQFRNFFAKFDLDRNIEKLVMLKTNGTNAWEQVMMPSNIEMLVDLILTQSACVFEMVEEADGRMQFLMPVFPQHHTLHIIRSALFELLCTLYVANPDFDLTTNDRQTQSDFTFLFGRTSDQGRIAAKLALIERLSQDLSAEPTASTIETVRQLVSGLYHASLTTYIALPKTIEQKCAPLRQSLATMHVQLQNVDDKTAAKLVLQLMHFMSQLVSLSEDAEVAVLLNRLVPAAAIGEIRNWLQIYFQLPASQSAHMQFDIQAFDAFFQTHLQPLLDSISPNARYEQIKTLGTTPTTPAAIQWGVVEPKKAYQLIECIKVHAGNSPISYDTDISILRAALFKFLHEFDAIKAPYALDAKTGSQEQKCFAMLFDKDFTKRKPKFRAALVKALTEETPSAESLGSMQVLTNMVCRLSRSKLMQRLVDETENEEAIDPVSQEDKLVLFASRQQKADHAEAVFINNLFLRQRP